MNIIKKKNIPNLVLECIKKPIVTAYESGLTDKSIEDCRSRFTIFHILNYIMYTETLDLFDKLDEKGMMKHKVKKCASVIHADWARYQREMRKDMEDSAWYLVQDFCMAAHESINSDLTILRISFHNYLLKKKVKNADVIAGVSVPLKIGDTILILWNAYFKTYQRVCGLDFSSDFAYANMSHLIHYLKELGALLSVGYTIDYNDDVNCVNAQAVLENHLANDDFQNMAAVKALSLSKTYRPRLEQLAKDMQELKKNEEIQMLSTKFDKVTRL